MKRTLYAIVISLALIILIGQSVLAATAQTVVVTAEPNYISFANSPGTWTANGITGSGVIDVNTTYYSNPLGDTTPPSATVADGECRFTVTNSSTVNIDYFVNCSDFSGGDADMTNSNTGSNDATSYGGYSWYSGMTYSSKVVMKSSSSDALATGQSGASFKWGAEIKTQTDAWAGGSASTADMVISVQAS